MNGDYYTLEEACRELEKITKENQILKATNEAYSAAEKSENDVWQIALKDMSAQLQVTASERAACQAALLKLQECCSSPICYSRSAKFTSSDSYIHSNSTLQHID